MCHLSRKAMVDKNKNGNLDSQRTEVNCLVENDTGRFTAVITALPR